MFLRTTIFYSDMRTLQRTIQKTRWLPQFWQMKKTTEKRMSLKQKYELCSRVVSGCAGRANSLSTACITASSATPGLAQAGTPRCCCETLSRRSAALRGSPPMPASASTGETLTRRAGNELAGGRHSLARGTADRYCSSPATCRCIRPHGRGACTEAVGTSPRF